MVMGLLTLGEKGPRRRMKRVQICMIFTTVAAICCGCGGAVSNRKNVDQKARLVAKDAAREELIEKYEAIAKGIRTLNLTVELKTTAGSKYSGVIEEYHEVKAFLLAARPEKIRMIGQAPVIGKTIFDMASDGETFRVSIPSKNKFLMGSVAAERASEKPIENLRPQHLLDALLWPEIRKEEQVFLEEFNDETGRYYVLTAVHGGYQIAVSRKIWFDRAELQVARLQTFGPKGALLSDARFGDWQAVAGDQETASAGSTNAVAAYPRKIRLERPRDEYTLDLTIVKVTLNGDLPAERFQIEQPQGSELVQVGEKTPEKKPADLKKDGKP